MDLKFIDSTVYSTHFSIFLFFSLSVEELGNGDQQPLVSQQVTVYVQQSEEDLQPAAGVGDDEANVQQHVQSSVVDKQQQQIGAGGDPQQQQPYVQLTTVSSAGIANA